MAWTQRAEKFLPWSGWKWYLWTFTITYLFCSQHLACPPTRTDPLPRRGTHTLHPDMVWKYQAQAQQGSLYFLCELVTLAVIHIPIIYKCLKMSTQIWQKIFSGTEHCCASCVNSRSLTRFESLCLLNHNWTSMPCQRKGGAVMHSPSHDHLISRGSAGEGWPRWKRDLGWRGVGDSTTTTTRTWQPQVALA